MAIRGRLRKLPNSASSGDRIRGFRRPSPNYQLPKLLDGFPPDFLAASLAGQRLLDAFFLARFQVEGMLLHFLNDVFLLNLSFKATQRIFDGLAILKSNLGQSVHPPSGCNRISIITYFDGYGDVSIVLRAGRQAILPG